MRVGSANDITSHLELIFGYNGCGRLLGSGGGPSTPGGGVAQGWVSGGKRPNNQIRAVGSFWLRRRRGSIYDATSWW